MLDDIRTFADLAAALSLATEPTLVTVEDDDRDVHGDFVVVSVEVKVTGDRNIDATELGLVPYVEPSGPLPPVPLERVDVLQQHMMALRSTTSTQSTTLDKVTTFKKPPNG
jgi:hypothetical protein